MARFRKLSKVFCLIPSFLHLPMTKLLLRNKNYLLRPGVGGVVVAVECVCVCVCVHVKK